MSQGPSLLFDKSTLESLSLNEAVLLDNFYRAPANPSYVDTQLKIVGERGRNRTFNLLFSNQQLKMNGFNDFPNVAVGRNGQF